MCFTDQLETYQQEVVGAVKVIALRMGGPEVAEGNEVACSAAQCLQSGLQAVQEIHAGGAVQPEAVAGDPEGPGPIRQLEVQPGAVLWQVGHACFCSSLQPAWEDLTHVMK